MKKISQLLLGLLLGSVVYSQQVNDPNVQVRDVKNFHAIHIAGPFDVYLTQSGEEKVAVSASEEGYRENITTEVKGGVLEIGWKHTQKLKFAKRKLKAYISFKSIDELIASGASDLTIVGGLKAEGLLINLSGAADLLTGNIDARDLTITISGASDMKITGSAGKLDINARGASSFKGYNFSVDFCDAKASGASDINITVNKELSVNATGASGIGYKGAAVIRNIRTSGASSISHKS